MLLNGYMMAQQLILSSLRIGVTKSFWLVPFEKDKMSMNKKRRMMGDCHVRFCERLTIQNIALLDFDNR